MASNISRRRSFFSQVHSGVNADEVTDKLLHELRNKLKVIHDPDSSTSTSLENPKRTPKRALDRWYPDHRTFL